MSNYYAVMGNPIAHSLSPLIHQDFAQQSGISLRYDKVLVEDPDFEKQVCDFFRSEGKGLNITLPFKQRAYQMTAQQTARAKLAKAANTLWMQEDQLWADNTDGIGFVRDLSSHVALSQKKVLLLGAGGAARGLIPVLLEEDIQSLTLANRSQQKALELEQEFKNIRGLGFSALKESFDLIINATSSSLSKETLALPSCLLHAHSFCYDLAYSLKEKTAFLQWAEAQGIAAVDGLGMLVEQAAESFFIWHGVHPDTKKVLKKLRPVSN